MRLRVLWWPGELPSEGDFLRTAAGSCYQIAEVRRTRPGSKALAVLRCVKLERDAVADGEPGVWRWEFSSRGR